MYYLLQGINRNYSSCCTCCANRDQKKVALAFFTTYEKMEAYVAKSRPSKSGFKKTSLLEPYNGWDYEELESMLPEDPEPI